MSPEPDPARPPVHVVAAVLRDARGRILLTRRTEGRDFAGAWEFPGGKVERGETPHEALARELREEIDIGIGPTSTPLIRVPHAYPTKRILLDVYEVPEWQGRVRALEKQAIAWTPPDKLAGYPTPPADIPVIGALTRPAAYLITPEIEPAAILAGVREALARMPCWVQLRHRGLDATSRERLAFDLRTLCRRAGARLLVNGDIALARTLGIGVHLRAAQLAELEARPLPAAQPVVASCHDAAELARAEALGCDAAVLGPVQATATHPDATPLGWSAFAHLRERVSLPIYALGGLAPTDLAEARQHGAQGIAAIRGLWPD